ncbi:hypothetical protein N7462_000428 [Penicillium macrosclerotiorum]|uniref:uncharacterized protein n=1 Tax=Penicillium macrosclerotiorum TaxID=303699 RepID=UPI002546C438|nr:uncharacterized protein N7462_000428 [Penicillium macrosclerotiorum]KAJ5698423.1 hypothetical protein N7462_000428 [Penicillium macrosclerotiorum]
MENEEQLLRMHRGHELMKPYPFTNSVGHFWGILETRDYMWARYSLADAMTRIHNVESTQTHLDHLMDMLRLCRADNLGVRAHVPALMLRLNKDQQCYDFIKWWSAIQTNTQYDMGNTDLPYLDIKDADVFESVDGDQSKSSQLSHIVCLTLLKIKLLLDLLKLERSTSGLGPRFPRKLFNMIQTASPQSPLIHGNTQLMAGEGKCRLESIEILKVQINMMYDSVNEHNKHFWLALQSPQDHLKNRPEGASKGAWKR